MKNQITEKLEQSKIKPTAMRELVYEVLYLQKKALSLSDIEQQFHNVDRSTIFRTLKIFLENRLIHSVDDGTGAVKYAVCDDSCSCNVDDLHVHFLCTKCRQTSCMKDIAMPKINLSPGYSFESANFVIKGSCPNCQ